MHDELGMFLCDPEPGNFFSEHAQIAVGVYSGCHVIEDGEEILSFPGEVVYEERAQPGATELAFSL